MLARMQPPFFPHRLESDFTIDSSQIKPSLRPKTGNCQQYSLFHSDTANIKFKTIYYSTISMILF
jgi:hypothetical protein